MTRTSAGSLDVDADAGAARTLIVRLRREPGSDYWRGQAICVQTGATIAVNLAPNDGNVAQLAVALHQLLEQSSSASHALTD